MTDSDVHNVEDKDQEPGAAAAKDHERGGFHTVFSALKHVNEASTTDAVRQRISDYITIGLVLVCILSLVAAVALPVKPGLRLLPLLFTFVAVIVYMTNRLGIIVSLSPRQALIIWQILMAAFWLGVTSAMLVLMSLFYFYKSHSSMF